MTIKGRVARLEKLVHVAGTVELVIPFIWRTRDDERWHNIPTEDELLALGAALAREGTRLDRPLWWQGSVEKTLAPHRGGDYCVLARAGVPPVRVVLADGPTKAYLFDPWAAWP